MIIAITIIIIWYVSGLLSFIFWWTRELDLTASVLPLMILVGFCGPFAFIMGWKIHGDPDLIIFKHRK